MRDDDKNHCSRGTTRSFGYPTSVVLKDDTVFTVYWDEDAEGVTSIVGSHYQVP